MYSYKSRHNAISKLGQNLKFLGQAEAEAFAADDEGAHAAGSRRDVLRLGCGALRVR
jgi:hypothetical protein